MNDVHLVLFLTRATPLATWHQVGILEREAALYRQLRPLVGSIRVVTSGGPEELRYRYALGDVEILYNRHGLPPNAYSLLAPLLHRRALQAGTLYKTNQLDGAWTALLAGQLYRKPVVVRAGYLWAPTFTKVVGRTWKTRLAHRLERLALRRADAVILTTAAMKQQVAGQYGIAPERIAVIPNFVDTELFRPDPQVTPLPGRILFVGRLEPEKNLPAVLEALKQTPGASLALVGQGSQGPALAAYAQQHGLAVEFLGRIPNTRLPEEIRRAEVFILPSLYEGHPKALIEAMACGAAVIGSDAPGIRELIRHEETGLLCVPGAAGIAAALRRLLADADLRARLGAAARAAAAQQFSLTSVVQTELALYRAVQGGAMHAAPLPASG
jgi:glycosyltransferase involved in cell wall biosynthesis